MNRRERIARIRRILQNENIWIYIMAALIALLIGAAMFGYFTGRWETPVA